MHQISAIQGVIIFTQNYSDWKQSKKRRSQVLNGGSESQLDQFQCLLGRNMENNQEKELRGRLMKMAIERNPPSTLIPEHQLIKLIVQQKIPVPILFKARYPQLLLTNMTSRKLFYQCLHELENMLKVSQECKAQRKKKKEKLHYDETFITTFVDLIFGEKEKQILFKIMSQSWPMDKKERQSWSNSEHERMQKIQIGQETLSYILKTIFLTDQATQSSSNSTSPDLTFDF